VLDQPRMIVFRLVEGVEVAGISHAGRLTRRAKATGVDLAGMLPSLAGYTGCLYTVALSHVPARSTFR